MKRVKSIGVFQTSKVVALIYFVISAIILIPLGLISSVFGLGMGSEMPFAGGIFFLIMPFFYGIIGFITTAIACFIYNLFASWIGGIELELEPVDELEV